MKKLLAILLFLSLTLTLIACGGQKDPTPDDDTVIRVGYFAGTTGIGMAGLLDDTSGKYEFKKYDGPTYITAALATGEVDIAALPTNAVPNFYNQSNGLVQMLAINTLGVLHICTNDSTIDDISDLGGKTIYVPEQAPRMVLEYILTTGYIDAEISMEYNLDTLPAAVAQGLVDIALLPEPKATVAQNMAKNAGNNNFRVAVDLTTEWNKVNDSPLVQGCLVVRKEFADNHKALVNSFLDAYEESIAYASNPENIDAVAATIVEAGILPNVAVAKSAIPRSNITYMAGVDMINTAYSFFYALGIDASSDDLYYNPEE